MKIIGTLAIALLVLLSACGDEYSDEASVHAVDIFDLAEHRNDR